MKAIKKKKPTTAEMLGTPIYLIERIQDAMRKTLFRLTFLLLVLIIASAWPAAAETAFYTISYDGNGTEVSIDDQPKYPGQDLTLSTSDPIWKGHIFLGWATSPAAENAEYQPGDTFSADGDTVLYAVWMDCADLGTVSGSQLFTISYPITKRFAYVAFTVRESGKYVIRSTGEYYKNTYATTRLEDDSWKSYSIDNVNNDFEKLLTLEAGKQYYLCYYHVQEPLQLEILYQYSGPDYHPDLKLPASATVIEAQAFAGSAFRMAEIPATVVSIGSGAFAGCGSLTHVLFRGSETEIAQDAFDDGARIIIIAPADSTAHNLAILKGYSFTELTE